MPGPALALALSQLAPKAAVGGAGVAAGQTDLIAMIQKILGQGGGGDLQAPDVFSGLPGNDLTGGINFAPQGQTADANAIRDALSKKRVKLQPNIEDFGFDIDEFARNIFLPPTMR